MVKSRLRKKQKTVEVAEKPEKPEKPEKLLPPAPQIPNQDKFFSPNMTRNEEESIIQAIKSWVKKEYQKDLSSESYWRDLDLKSFINGSKDSGRFNTFAFGLLSYELGMDVNEAKSAATNLLAHLQEHFKFEDEDVAPVSEDSLKVEFKNEYKGCALELFQKRVKDSHNLWSRNPDKWHSPYFDVLQSLGYGKSRMCKEFALQDLTYLTVYICLRETDTGYPKPHSATIAYLKRISFKNIEVETDLTNRINEIKMWLLCWKTLRILHYHLYFRRGTITKNETENENENEILLDKMRKFIRQSDWKIQFKGMLEAKKNSVVADEENERKLFWQLCEDPTTANQLHTNFIAELISQGSLSILPLSKINFLLVLDDANSFLTKYTMNYQREEYTLFRLFRMCLPVLGSSSFAVLVDTTTQLRNFVPVRPPHVSSMRLNASTERGGELFPPFTWVTTMDVVGDETEESQRNLEKVFTRGRPLWQTTYRGIDDEDTTSKLAQLLDFAWEKLSCGYSMDESNESVAMALLAVLTGLSISPHSKLAEELVASHLGTCLGISDDRGSVFMSYPQEPILSLASLQKLWLTLHDGNLLESVLYPLISFLRIGVVNTGDSGEFVVKLLLLLAQGKATFSSEDVASYFEAVDFKFFMECLLGEHGCNSVLEELTGLNTLVQASCKLSFTCFCKVERKVVLGKQTAEQFWATSSPESILKAFYNRNAALDFPENQSGADLLLPVQVRPNEFKYILVQVQNIVDVRELEGTLNKLTPAYVFGEHSNWVQFDIGFGILINVGDVEPNSSKPVQAHSCTDGTHKREYVVLNGLSAFKPLFAQNVENGSWDKVIEGLDTILHGNSVFDGIKLAGEEEDFVVDYYQLLKGMKE